MGRGRVWNATRDLKTVAGLIFTRPRGRPGGSGPGGVELQHGTTSRTALSNQSQNRFQDSRKVLFRSRTGPHEPRSVEWSLRCLAGAPSRMALTRSERELSARLAAHSLHAQVDSREHTEPAQVAFMARFDDEVDRERTFPEAERVRRAEQAKKAYFTRLALRSAQARRRS